jgi:hypothetical protein
MAERATTPFGRDNKEVKPREKRKAHGTRVRYSTCFSGFYNLQSLWVVAWAPLQWSQKEWMARIKFARTNQKTLCCYDDIPMFCLAQMYFTLSGGFRLLQLLRELSCP